MAIGWERTSLMSSSRSPGRASSAWLMRILCSPTMCTALVRSNSLLGSSGPAMVFSMAIAPYSAWPSVTACTTCSKLSYSTGTTGRCELIKYRRIAASWKHPAMPCMATRSGIVSQMSAPVPLSSVFISLYCIILCRVVGLMSSRFVVYAMYRKMYPKKNHPACFAACGMSWLSYLKNEPWPARRIVNAVIVYTRYPASLCP